MLYLDVKATSMNSVKGKIITLAYLFLKIMFSQFDKPRKAQNARASAAP